MLVLLRCFISVVVCLLGGGFLLLLCVFFFWGGGVLFWWFFRGFFCCCKYPPWSMFLMRNFCKPPSLSEIRQRLMHGCKLCGLWLGGRKEMFYLKMHSKHFI